MSCKFIRTMHRQVRFMRQAHSAYLSDFSLHERGASNRSPRPRFVAQLLNFATRSPTPKRQKNSVSKSGRKTRPSANGFRDSQDHRSVSAFLKILNKLDRLLPPLAGHSPHKPTAAFRRTRSASDRPDRGAQRSLVNRGGKSRLRLAPGNPGRY